MLCAIMMVVLFAMVAFAVDIGYVLTARSQLQTSADAAAMAACWELIDDNCFDENWDGPNNARATASQFAGLNLVAGDAPALHNDSNTDGDVLVGHLANPHDASAVMNYGTPGEYNAVQVRVRRNGDQNGEVGLHFARLLGINSMALEAQATAALVKHVRGFRLPAQSTDKIMILPFTLDQDTWASYVNGGAFTDEWTYDPETRTVTAGPDGIREINLYPEGQGASASRGTVDIGGHDANPGDVGRQIVQGVNAADLAHHGGRLELDAGGQLSLEGATGIDLSIQSDLDYIRGRPRIIPVFTEAQGGGDDTNYCIGAFVGVRVVYVDLTGATGNQCIMVQPANMITRGAIATTEAGTSEYIYTPVHLVR
jgi:hypothetical protein